MRLDAQGRIDRRALAAQGAFMRLGGFKVLVWLSCIALAGPACSEPTDGAAARFNAFQRQLLASASATATLGHWCADLHLAEPPRIRAWLRRDEQKAVSAEVRHRLAADPGEKIIYRRVDLVCGDHVLSRADNWYRPTLLTPDMNHRLENTDTPFGEAVAAMDFHRQTLGVSRPRGGKLSGAVAPPVVLRVRALLISGAGAPFAFVQENYTNAILGDLR
jgi:hypothetical protein